MRPKKIIIILGTDEQSLSVLAYKLRVHGFRDVPVETIPEAQLYATTNTFDLLLITQSLSLEEANALADRVRAVTSSPILLMHKPWPLGEYDKYPLFRGTSVLPSDTLTSELLDRIKILTKRKRGPRKGSHLPAGDAIAEEQVIACVA